jgi:hypothetical protein
MDAAVEPRSRLPRVTRPRIRIGEILLNMGALSEADLQKVLAEHLDRGEPFGKVAVSMKLITEQELRSALAQQFTYPIARIGESALSPLLAAAYEPFGQYAEGLRTLRSQLLMRWMASMTARSQFAPPVAAKGAAYWRRIWRSCLPSSANGRC